MRSWSTLGQAKYSQCLRVRVRSHNTACLLAVLLRNNPVERSHGNKTPRMMLFVLCIPCIYRNKRRFESVNLSDGICVCFKSGDLIFRRRLVGRKNAYAIVKKIHPLLLEHRESPVGIQRTRECVHLVHCLSHDVCKILTRQPEREI